MRAKQESEALLEALCANADPRKARSLRLIHAICLEQQDRGSFDYSIATIGRLSADRGGPAAGAIRNKTGEVYRVLIKTFADSTRSNTRENGEIGTAPVDLILEGVADPVLRTRLGLLLAELKATRAQLLAARHLANQTAMLDFGEPLPEERPAKLATGLTPLEVRALGNAISADTLHHWGWHADESGRIVTDSGRTVFAAGFVTAISKVLASLRSSPAQHVMAIDVTR
jgi:hypothetical protein